MEHISFDLDGTLVNSHNTIYKSAMKTLEHLNIAGKIHEEEFYKRIGHHFLDIFRDMNISVPDIEHFINIYKSYYFDYIDHSSLYENVPDILEEVSSRGIKISLLTTKGQDQAELILKHFKIAKYFDYVMGRRIGMGIKPSPEPLFFICNELNVLTGNTLMVGDSDLDVNCGKNAGTKTCAVTYGYRTPEILKELKPDYLINDIREIIKIIS